MVFPYSRMIMPPYTLINEFQSGSININDLGVFHLEKWSNIPVQTVHGRGPQFEAALKTKGGLISPGHCLCYTVNPMYV